MHFEVCSLAFFAGVYDTWPAEREGTKAANRMHGGIIFMFISRA